MLSVKFVSINPRLRVDFISYKVFWEFVDCFLRNAALDPKWYFHGQLIPFASASAI
jgi:hypothetical protein